MSYGHTQRSDPPSRIVPATQLPSRVRAPSSMQERIPANTITAELIAAEAVTAEKIAAGAITAGAIEAGSITADKIAVGAVGNAQIATDAVTAEKILNGSITGVLIANGAVTATKIATNAVTANKIQAGAITADKIEAGAITTDKLNAGIIWADVINVSELSALSANIGDVTAGVIRNAGSSFVIDLNATGSQNLLTAPGLTISASGNAVFSGSVAASTFTAPTASFLAVLEVNGSSGVRLQSFPDFGGDHRVTVGGGLELAATSAGQSLTASGILRLSGGTATRVEGSAFSVEATNIGFYGTVATSQQTVTGSRSGGAALENLLLALDNLGLIIDSTSG